MSRPVIIVDYDPRWPSIYEEEKRRILGAVGNMILGVEHIGSTAVIGLGAKPIIDIIAGVKSYTDADQLLPLLRQIGYEDVNRQSGDSEWYYCLGKVIHAKEVWRQNFHLHLMKFKSNTWERHILFRDFLRNHPEVAKKYLELKKMLATEYSVNRKNYTNGKTKFIASAVKKANES